MSISGQAGGLHVALSDLLLVAVAAALLLDRGTVGTRATMHALRPSAFAVLPYCVGVFLCFPPTLA